MTKLLTAVILIGAPTSALASPRTLASGAPACGNTMEKGGYNDGCTSEERAEWRIEREAERANEKLRAVRAARMARAEAKRVNAIKQIAEALAAALPWKAAPEA
ncbi:MAG: hypothetical protein ABI175_16735 [Polyangiales bacterium]